MLAEEVGDQNLFFIVYKARSGSTYLADILARHPDIGIAPESNFVLALWNWSGGGSKVVVTRAQLTEVLNLVYSESKFRTWGIDKATLFDELLTCLPLSVGDLARQIISIYCRQRYPGSRIYGLKKGAYIRHIPSLLKLFLDAKLIHIIRDGRAVFASSKKATHSETGLPFETNPSLSALHWKHTVSIFDQYREKEFALEVKYEELLREPEKTLGEILSFLRVYNKDFPVRALLEPHHESLLVHERYAHLHPNVGKLPQLSRISTWQQELSQSEIKAFERMVGSALLDKGYALTYPITAWDNVKATCVEISEMLRNKLLFKIFSKF
jgi:hypothetical protein